MTKQTLFSMCSNCDECPWVKSKWFGNFSDEWRRNKHQACMEDNTTFVCHKQETLTCAGFIKYCEEHDMPDSVQIATRLEKALRGRNV